MFHYLSFWWRGGEEEEEAASMWNLTISPISDIWGIVLPSVTFWKHNKFLTPRLAFYSSWWRASGLRTYNLQFRREQT